MTVFRSAIIDSMHMLKVDCGMMKFRIAHSSLVSEPFRYVYFEGDPNSWVPEAIITTRLNIAEELPEEFVVDLERREIILPGGERLSS